MNAARVGLTSFSLGVALVFAGLYATASVPWTLYISAMGVLAVLVGLVFLLMSARALPRSWPHPGVVIVCLIAIALYAYVAPFNGLALGWWLWAAAPYVMCVLVSCVTTLHQAAVAGAVAVLVFDAYIHYTVVTSTSSTAALAYIFSPVWNTLVFGPIATLLAWLALRRRHAGNGAP